MAKYVQHSLFQALKIDFCHWGILQWVELVVPHPSFTLGQTDRGQGLAKEGLSRGHADMVAPKVGRVLP